VKRTRLRPVSNKRRDANAERRVVVEGRFGRRPACEACLPLQLIGVDRSRTGCDGWATDAHELVSRARGGSIVDTDNIRPVSRACHTFITTHPCEAEDAGLALPSGPVTQPLRAVDPRTGLFPRAVP
jgi:hypothetical protein